MEIEREILEKLVKMEDYLNELKKIFPGNVDEFLSNIEKKYACYFLFVQIVEELSDIISLFSIKFTMLSDDFYTDLDRVSRRVDFIKNLREKLARIRKIRNLVIYHYYEKIDDKKLYHELRESLKVFEEFIDKTREWISKS